jgi:hypothetical protein
VAYAGFVFSLDMKNKDIFDKLQEAYGEVCASYACVSKRAKVVRDGRTSVADGPRSRRLPIPDEVERIRAKVEYRPYQSDSTIARDRGPSKTYLFEVLKRPEIEKYMLRWVLHSLNDDQKAVRAEIAASMRRILEPLTAHAPSCASAEDES